MGICCPRWRCLCSRLELAFSGSQSKTYKKTDMSSPDLDKVSWYVYNLTTGKTGKEKVAKDTPGYCTHEVGLKAANKLGLYDMSGNVYEWCRNELKNPQGEVIGYSYVLRGGSCAVNSNFCRISFRSDFSLGIKYFNYGFRVVLEK